MSKRARRDYWAFCLLFHPPGHSDLVFGEAHRYLINLVQQIDGGTKGKRQAVSMPPQHGKSTILTLLAVAWLLGKQPGISIAITSFSYDLVTSWSRQIKDIINSPLYQSVFPGSNVKFGSNRADHWQTNWGSRLLAKATGNKLTGRRVDWLIIDDPHAGREEAESAVMRTKVHRWYYADCVTRLSPDATVFLIQTRWHPEDLIGHLTTADKVAFLTEAGQEKEIFEVTNLKCLCDDPDNDPLGREFGEYLFPEVRTPDFLDGIKATLPHYEWSSQYQGEPMISANQVDLSNINWINQEQLPEGLEWVRAWDTAVTEQQLGDGDYTAGALCSYDRDSDRFFIREIFRNRRAWTENRKIISDMGLQDKERYGTMRIGFEAVSQAMGLLQDVRMRLEGEARVINTPPKPRGGKLLRAMPWLVKIDAKQVYVCRGAWNGDFISELEAFPMGAHDDQVDAVSMCWELFHMSNVPLLA